MNDAIAIEFSRMRKQFNFYRMFLKLIKDIELTEEYEWSIGEEELLLKLLKEDNASGVRTFISQRFKRITDKRRKLKEPS